MKCDGTKLTLIVLLSIGLSLAACSSRDAAPPVDGAVDDQTQVADSTMDDTQSPDTIKVDTIKADTIKVDTIKVDGAPVPDVGTTDGPMPVDGSGNFCGSSIGVKCSKGYTCDIQICAPGASGKCVLTPKMCPLAWAPVCGCDSKTYGNDCERIKAGAALMHVGQCKVTDGGTPVDGAVTKCGGSIGVKCSKGYTCDVYGCAPGSSGKCVLTPTMCPLYWAPVCGCDNKTYGNDCMRIMAGVGRKHTGQCKVTDGGITPTDGAVTKCGGSIGVMCSKGYTCDVLGCAPGASGKCVITPGTCPYLWAPVCGCNNKTYANECERIKAGVALKHTGQCKATDGGITPTDGAVTTKCGGSIGVMCSKGYTCDVLGCAPGASGKCVITPGMCPYLWAPVCGCNNKTYANDCERIKAGVARMHTGQCKATDGGITPTDGAVTTKCGGSIGVMCSKGYVCDIQSCLLGATGTCVKDPAPCSYLWAPVCGCDNKTYSNNCLRLTQSVALKNKGQCP